MGPVPRERPGGCGEGRPGPGSGLLEQGLGLLRERRSGQGLSGPQPWPRSDEPREGVETPAGGWEAGVALPRLFGSLAGPGGWDEGGSQAAAAATGVGWGGLRGSSVSTQWG